MHSNQRGFTLVTVLVVLTVMALLVAGALTFTGQEVASATQHVRRESMAACVEAARSYVLSQIRTGAEGRVVNRDIQGELDMGDFLVRTGHLDATSAQPAVAPCAPSGGGVGMIDLTNTTLGAGGSFGRQCLRIVAHCIDKQTQARREVEFQMILAL